MQRNRFLSAFFLCLLLVPTGVSADWSKADSANIQDKKLGQKKATAYGAWRSCKIGGGGYVQNVVFTTNPKRLYAYVDVGGVYRSDDGGRRWRMINRTLRQHSVRSLLVDPRNPDLLLAAVGNQWDGGREGICRSTDGGVTWKKVQDALFYGNEDYRSAGVLLARDPRNPDIVFAATGKNGVLRSSDNGKTWKKTTGATGIYPTDLKADRRGKRLVLCAQSAKTWRDGEMQGGYFFSNDNGLTWQKQSDAAPTEVVQDMQKPDVWYGLFTTAPIIRISRDNGKTWSDFSQGLPPYDNGNNAVSDVQYDALGVATGFAVIGSRRGTFYRRGANETAWKKVKQQTVTEIYEGEDWYARMEPGRFQHFGAAMGSIVMDPRNPNRWFFTDWYAIYRTEDAGKNWNLSMDGVEVTVLHCLTPDPANPRWIHLGMADNGYLRSKNGGERFYNPHINSNMKSIAVSPADPNRVFGVGDPGNGQWRANTVWLSADRGATWKPSPMTGLPNRESHNINSIAVSPTDPNLVFVAVSQGVRSGEGGIYRSSDGGNRWQWIGEGLPTGESLFRHDIWTIGREVAVDGAGNLIAVSHEKWQVFRRPAGSRQWESVTLSPQGFQPRSMIADPKTPGVFYVAGSGQGNGVYRTADAGKTWKRISTESVSHIGLDPVRPQFLVIGLKNGVAYSRNAGKTWQRLDDQLPARDEVRVAISGNRVLVGTAGSGAFWRELPR